MYDGRTHLALRHSKTTHGERRRVGGTVAFLLTVHALVIALTAPAVALGVVLGVAGVTVGERAVRRLGRDSPSPSATGAGRPA